MSVCMSQIPSDWKRCCTCEYWAGRRDIYDNSCSKVLVNTGSGDAGEKGKCMKRGSGWTHQMVQHCHNCASYEKWRMLR